MGMAASQARFLSLTARKSNTEYEGQQINQERTALANESSNLYAELTKLDVPSPPNTSDFYKTIYTFTAKELSGEKTTYTLDEIISTPDGDKAILTYDEPYYSVSLVNFGKTGATVTDGLKDTDLSEEEKAAYKNKTLTGFALSMPDGTEYQILTAKAGNLASSVDYIANHDGGNKAYQDAYFKNNTLDKNADVYYYEVGNQKYFLDPNILKDEKTMASFKVAQEAKPVKDEYPITNYTTNDMGRTTSITVVVGKNEKNEDIVKTYELECVTVEDEEAYNQAMLDYEYYQSKYEKQVSDINAKTEDIQQKDKSLELELKQLDTEQNAISTEMDAVKKVVEDNVEATFKTFG